MRRARQARAPSPLRGSSVLPTHMSLWSHRSLRTGERRHTVPRRGCGHSARDTGEALESASGANVRARGWQRYGAEYSLRRFALENRKRIEGFSSEARSKLAGHRWPGNVRELENTLDQESGRNARHQRSDDPIPASPIRVGKARAPGAARVCHRAHRRNRVQRLGTPSASLVLRASARGTPACVEFAKFRLR